MRRLGTKSQDLEHWVCLRQWTPARDPCSGGRAGEARRMGWLVLLDKPHPVRPDWTHTSYITTIIGVPHTLWLLGFSVLVYFTFFLSGFPFEIFPFCLRFMSYCLFWLLHCWRQIPGTSQHCPSPGSGQMEGKVVGNNYNISSGLSMFPDFITFNPYNTVKQILLSVFY